jgi:hypothetical protein
LSKLFDPIASKKKIQLASNWRGQNIAANLATARSVDRSRTFELTTSSATVVELIASPSAKRGY